MNLLDENVRRDQGDQLRRWRVPFRVLTEDVAHPGIQDPDILPVLHRLARPTFFTHDRDFFRRALVHPGYCLVWLDVFDGKAAEFIRWILKQPEFRTTAQRMGVVARAHPGGIHFWRRGAAALQRVAWSAWK